MTKRYQYLTLGVLLFFAFIFTLYSFHEDKSTPLIPYSSKKSMLDAAFYPMTFYSQEDNAGLIKSKNCDASKVYLSIRPEFKILESSNQILRVLIDGIEYDTLESISAHMFFSKENLVDFKSYAVPIPAYSEFNKSKLPIICEYYSDNRLVHSIKDTIQFIDNNEEIVYQDKRGSIGHGGDCRKASYFENETLFSVDKKGKYFLEKDFITTITRENDRYKIETNSPPGFLVFNEDKSYRIPVPAYPSEISYVDSSIELKPGVYKNKRVNLDGFYEVKEEDLNKYLGYNYNLAPISYKKRIVFNDCLVSELDKDCIQIPSGVNIRFVNYPENIANDYRSL